MAKSRLAKKMEVPSYENKREFPILQNKQEIKSNLVEVVIAHDGLMVGQQFTHNEGTIDKMVNLGYWKRV
jgi:hypothetical protein